MTIFYIYPDVYSFIYIDGREREKERGGGESKGEGEREDTGMSICRAENDFRKLVFSSHHASARD